MHFVIFLWQLLWGIWAMMYIPLKPVQLSGICVGNHSQSTLSLCTQSKPIKTNSHPFVLVQIMSLSFLDFIWPQSPLSLLFSLVLHQRRVFAESVGGFWISLYYSTLFCPSEPKKHNRGLVPSDYRLLYHADAEFIYSLYYLLI